jgi:hypothetical protein
MRPPEGDGMMRLLITLLGERTLVVSRVGIFMRVCTLAPHLGSCRGTSGEMEASGMKVKMIGLSQKGRPKAVTSGQVAKRGHQPSQMA